MQWILSIAVLYNQGKSIYLESLEKRISVDYVYQDKVIMQVIEAYLPGESDIRQWAQTLGRQLCDGRVHLSFDMVFDITEVNRRITRDGSSFLHNKVIMYLDQDPTKDYIVLKNDQPHEKGNRVLPAIDEFKNSWIMRSKDSIWTWTRNNTKSPKININKKASL